jgi:hypothetical protein
MVIFYVIGEILFMLFVGAISLLINPVTIGVIIGLLTGAIVIG